MQTLSLRRTAPNALPVSIAPCQTALLCLSQKFHVILAFMRQQVLRVVLHVMQDICATLTEVT